MTEEDIQKPLEELMGKTIIELYSLIAFCETDQFQMLIKASAAFAAAFRENTVRAAVQMGYPMSPGELRRVFDKVVEKCEQDITELYPQYGRAEK